MCDYELDGSKRRLYHLSITSLHKYMCGHTNIMDCPIGSKNLACEGHKIIEILIIINLKLYRCFNIILYIYFLYDK